MGKNSRRNAADSPAEADSAAQTRLEWALRAAALVVGLLLALGYVSFLQREGVDSAGFALGDDTVTLSAQFDGRTIGAHELEQYPTTLVARDSAGSWSRGAEGLWLGNSQLHAINGGDAGSRTAADRASARLGLPLWSLTLPNASLQEHLLVFEWALLRRRPDVLVLSLVFDDLREDGLRPGFDAVADAALIARLRERGDPGQRLGSLLEEQLPAGQVAGGGDYGDEAVSESTQDRVDTWFDTRISAIWPLWRGRSDARARFLTDLYLLRNAAFGIKATTRREMIPVRYERNMAALDTLLERASDAGIPVLLYVVPLRWNPAPPYDVEAYTAWKQTVASRAASRPGVRFADLDRLVPDELWGAYGETGAIDFMHFKESGHELLGARIADLVGEVLSSPRSTDD